MSVGASATAFNWLEPLIQRMDEEYGLDASETSWLVSSVEYGELALTVPVGFFGDWYGRKPVLLSTGPVCLVAWGLLLVSRSIYVLYLVRFLQGAALAIVFAIAPLYIAEISEAKVRGMLAGQFQTMWAFGLLFSYITGPNMMLESYIYVCGIMPLIFTLFFVLMPETPYYYLMNKKDNEARRALKWLRGTTKIDDELKRMKDSVEKDMENKASWKELFSTGKNRRIFFTVQMLCFLKYMIGSPAMSSYTAETFSHASNGALNEHQATLIFGLLLLVSAIVGSFLSDSVGRRPLLVGTCFLIAVSYAFTAAYFYLEEHTVTDVRSYVWVMYLSIGFSTVLSNIGPSSLLQTIQGELFPSNTRAMGGALTGVTGAIATFLDLKQYQTMVEYFGLYMNFVIFSAFSLVGSALIYFILKETAGKSLGEIQTGMDVNESEKNQDIVSFPKPIEVITEGDR